MPLSPLPSLNTDSLPVILWRLAYCLAAKLPWVHQPHQGPGPPYLVGKHSLFLCGILSPFFNTFLKDTHVLLPNIPLTDYHLQFVLFFSQGRALNCTPVSFLLENLYGLLNS